MAGEKAVLVMGRAFAGDAESNSAGFGRFVYDGEFGLFLSFNEGEFFFCGVGEAETGGSDG